MMAATEWDAALDEFRKIGTGWAALRPSCEALLPVVERLRADSRVGTVALQISHATLVIGFGSPGRRVALGWDTDHYEVFFVDPGFEFVDGRRATQHEVVDVVIDYLERARASVR